MISPDFRSFLRLSRRSWPLALALAGCRGRAQDPVKEPVEKQDGGGSEDVAGIDLTIGGGGPKIMGYEYLFRMSAGVLKGTYSDKQLNDTVGREAELPDVATQGKRYVLEHYPVVYENYPRSQYGYALLELRDETTEALWWEKRQTVIALMGYVLPKWRLLAPVVGVHWEFNKIDMSLDESPEVSKSDIRAFVAGVNTRQKIWGLGEWLGVFYQGKLHLLNPTMGSTGWEAEAGLGTTMQFGFLRVDGTAGYLEQRYSGRMRASADDERELKVNSRQQAMFVQGTFWM